MATAEISSARERAVLGRVRGQLGKHGGYRVIGIRSPDVPQWHGPHQVELDGTRVRIAPCRSVLAVLDALADADDHEVLVLLTDLPESELGDAVLARLHRGKLLEADRYTELEDLLDARSVDPRIRRETWLVDALVGLAGAGRLPSTTGEVLSLQRAIALVAGARLGVDPEQADLPALVAAFDDTRVRADWRMLSDAERSGLVEHLGRRHGPGVAVVAALSERHDNVLAELLVAQVITAAPEPDTRAARAFGGFTQSRFSLPRPTRADLAAAAGAAVVHAREAPTVRLNQQIRHAEAALDELSALELAAFSPILSRSFVERLAAAAERLDDAAFAELDDHAQARVDAHRVERVRAARRVQRWLDSNPQRSCASVTEGLARHSRDLAWLDRALTQIRAGDAEPRVAAVLRRLAERASAARAAVDVTFAQQLARMDATPRELLAVETLLPRAVAPLAEHAPVLLVVVDGMSGAVAGDLTARLADRRDGWTEIVRSDDGGREAVLAALPTETRYSRASLFAARLTTGDQAAERSAFAAHPFWPRGGAVLVHKSGVAGRDGSDLGLELEQAVEVDGPRVVAVVLNAVDDSLSKGRQSLDPAWRPEDIPGLPQLLDRAVTAGRVVLLTSDHGHVLEHGAAPRHQVGGGARWRPDDGVPRADEVSVGGARVLTLDERVILAATEDVRYGPRAHGYHGGATLAEVAIPLIGLLPPGVAMPEGWTTHTIGPPSWWDGATPVVTPVAAPKRRSSKKAPTQNGDGLFELPSTGPATRGASLVASATFREAHAEIPRNRAPEPAVFQAVVDALVTAGGRLPLRAVATAAGASGRNPRGLVSVMGRVLNRDSYPVLTLVDNGQAVALNLELLDEQFPSDGVS
ncbi:BREX-2 system phosphatase PglZ [Pseudonocardia zijingensis]|uniref:BREX-2 system phosphatase PglZ n=1 Tax=Pseudonocardia zijingensis TaxID=153376 RepID=A0ABN1PEG7_9PSEU